MVKVQRKHNPALQIILPSDKLRESYIYTDPEELPGELLLTPTFCERHGLQPYDYQDQNEPLSKKASNRRLTLHQTKTLERSYSMDNKLEPVLKNKLALELGLQPRQVAIWYQNRRARNKAKSIEGKYAALKLQYQEVVLRNRRLEAEVSSLREKLQTEERTKNGAKRQPDPEESSRIEHDYCLVNQNQTQNAALCKQNSLFPSRKYSTSDIETVMISEPECGSIALSKIGHDYVSLNNDSLMDGVDPQVSCIAGQLESEACPQEQQQSQCMTGTQLRPHFQEEHYNVSSLSCEIFPVYANPVKSKEYLMQLATSLANLDDLLFNDSSFMQHDVCLCCN